MTRTIDLIVIHRSEAGVIGAVVATNEPHAYHLFITKDGNLEWALSQQGFDLSFELPGAHAVGWNHRSVGVAVYGCFDTSPDGKLLSPPPHNLHPTQAQLDTLYCLCEGLTWWFGHKLYIAGHTELPGSSRYPGKQCPGRNLDVQALRLRLGATLPPY